MNSYILVRVRIFSVAISEVQLALEGWITLSIIRDEPVRNDLQEENNFFLSEMHMAIFSR